jgi:poly(3-hydroxybutyrate) depolymerase
LHDIGYMPPILHKPTARTKHKKLMSVLHKTTQHEAQNIITPWQQLAIKTKILIVYRVQRSTCSHC